MNNLSRDKQIEVVAALTEGLGIRAAARITGVNRETVGTLAFIQDLRERVIGYPEISTDGWHPYKLAIRNAFGGRAAHGTIVKTLSVTDLRKDAAHRYSPAAVVAVSREIISGEPEQISTSYVERQNLSLRMASKRFARLSNGFSKHLDCHVAAVSLVRRTFTICVTWPRA